MIRSNDQATSIGPSTYLAEGDALLVSMLLASRHEQHSFKTRSTFTEDAASKNSVSLVTPWKKSAAWRKREGERTRKSKSKRARITRERERERERDRGRGRGMREKREGERGFSMVYWLLLSFDPFLHGSSGRAS